MNTEELLKRRYKVIADYPKSIYEVGTIIRAYLNDNLYCDDNGPKMSQYPHLFKPLKWWEERRPDDLPEYVKAKSSGNVTKVNRYDFSKNTIFIRNGKNEDNCPLTLSSFLTYRLPSTQEEYEQSLVTNS